MGRAGALARAGGGGRFLAVREAVAARAGRVERRLRGLDATLPGRLVRWYAATLGWIALWAWYDIAVVVFAFPSEGASASPPRIDVYWAATWYVLFPVVTVLVFRRSAWLPILAVWGGGWEDILFYWLQGRPVPALTPWILFAPTAALLYAKAGAFLAGSVLAQVVHHRRFGRGPAAEYDETTS